MYNKYDRETKGTWKESLCYLYTKIIKMYPLYLLCLIAASVLKFQGLSVRMMWIEVLDLLCIQSWSPLREVSMSFNGLSWYLSTILFCYFISPFLITVIKSIKKIDYLFGSILLGRLWLEYLCINFSEELLVIDIYTNPIVRAMEFALGMIAAISFLKRNNRKGTGMATCIELFTLVMIVVINVKFYALYSVCYTMLFLVLIVVFASGKGYVSKMLSNDVFMAF